MQNIQLKSILLLFVGITFFACKTEQRPTSISTDISIENVDYLLLSNLITGLSDTLKLKQTGHEVMIDEAMIASLAYGNNTIQIYLEPGASITIQSLDDELAYSGDLEKENSYLYQLDLSLSEANKKFGLMEIAKNEEEAFLAKLDNKKSFIDSFLQSYSIDNKMIKDFSDLTINAKIANDKMSYGNYYTYLTKDTLKESENYYDFVDDLDTENPLLLASFEGRGLLENIVGRDIEFGNSISEYFQELYEKADKTFSNKEAKEYLMYTYLNNSISFGGGLDGTEKLVESFAANNTNAGYSAKIDQLISEWENLRKGKEAPQFDGLTKDGEAIALADLKGKHVYIDVWATWCGPCIAEIPSLKEVEHDYHDEEIEFVSVSIDQQKDKEKWMKFIQDRELGGVQLMEDNDWKSEIATNYNIKGIPRFILIDKEGKIVSANAPRPSNPDLRDMLDAL